MGNVEYTLDYYKENADEFYESTVIAEVEYLRERFLKNLPEKAHILDLGCGSGRDTKAFVDQGYEVDAIDGSPEMCELASSYTGIDVKCMDFFDLKDSEKYDGIWSCASILHVDKDRIPEMIVKMRDALKTGGVMYLSFKYGEFCGLRDGRYFVDLNEELFAELIKNVSGIRIIDEWVSVDVRRGKDVTWLNEVIRRED
ncbi:Methyltransferase domain-containing protein [Eubacterium ruminantium]|nr:Methyltransferase domain-containing protein [Eubacterium ruminantium]